VTYNLALRYMIRKHDSIVVMKYEYRCSTYLSFWPVAHKEICLENFMNMKGSNMTKLLVVATLTARLLDLCCHQ
jgi:hypothetical protein